jgi:hypothetical protein
MVLDDDQRQAYARDGAVRLDAAFPREVADECRALLWRATDCREDDPSTWTRPVVRIDYRGEAAFAAAAASARLAAACDQLVGVGRWRGRRDLGTFPIRFPSDADPGDAGWHIESTGSGPDGRAVVDPTSDVRVLLMLFLFSEVGPDDAPTRLRAGSHHVVTDLLADGRPRDFFEISAEAERRTADLPELVATGSPGDVWLCHPFVVHAAQRHRGTRPRFMAQPPLPGRG